MTLEEAKGLVAKTDSDGDGTLNFNEFVAFMNRPEPVKYTNSNPTQTLHLP